MAQKIPNKRRTTMTPKEITTIKTAASDYAKRFLTHKYSLEYSELYEAYCNNRGVNTRGSHRLPPVDERLLGSHE
jgi:hypothetical protein